MSSFSRFSICFVLLIMAATTLLADSALPPPANIRMTNVPQLNNEEQVFICPTDSNIIIANWRDFRTGFRRVGIGRSTDGGLTWTDSLIATSEMLYFVDSKQSDPTMTVDRLGSFYMSVLDWDAFGISGESTIAFYRSDDKGLSWFGPYSVLNHVPNGIVFEDKQFITVDRTNGVYDGNLYCIWARFYDGPNRILFARSTDGGVTFEDTVVVGPNQTSTGCGASVLDGGQFANVAVTPNGDVHIFWQGTVLDSGATCSGHIGIKHRVSTDGGQTFAPESEVLPVSGYTQADGGINTYSQPAVWTDFTGGPHDGNIYIAFTNQGPEDVSNTDVDFVRSFDNGLTWSNPIRINDDLNSDLIDNFHPWLVVNEEGVIIVIFHDQRYDVGNYFDFDLNAAYSFDGGLSFTSNHRISDVSSSPSFLRLPFDDLPFDIDDNGFVQPFSLAPRAGLLGEYIGVTAYYDKVNAVWTDSRDFNSEVYTANWYLPLLEPRLQVPADTIVVQNVSFFQWSTAWKESFDSYRLEIAEDAGFTSGLLLRSTTDRSLILDVTLAEGTFYWRVKAFALDTGDSSEYSVVRSFEIDGTPPEVATLLSPVDSLVTNNGMPQFQWDHNIVEVGQTDFLQISTDELFPVGPSTQEYVVGDSFHFIPPVPIAEGVQSYWRVATTDAADNKSESVVRHIKYIDYICGDIDGSGFLPDVNDLTYLVRFLFQGGSAPVVMESSNVDGIIGPAGPVDINDLTYLVAYFFQSGPPLVC